MTDRRTDGRKDGQVCDIAIYCYRAGKTKLAENWPRVYFSTKFLFVKFCRIYSHNHMCKMRVLNCKSCRETDKLLGTGNCGVHCSLYRRLSMHYRATAHFVSESVTESMSEPCWPVTRKHCSGLLSRNVCYLGISSIYVHIVKFPAADTDATQLSS